MKKSIALIAVAAFLAVPSLATAQSSTGALTDKVKDKAVDTVLENATKDDALRAGKTLLKGGSKEDAAKAVLTGRAEDKVEGLTGTKVDLDDLSKDGMIDAGKDVAVDKAKGSATKFINGAPAAGGSSTGSVKDAAKDIAIEKAKSSATSYGDQAAGSAKKYGDKAAGSHTAPIIHKSGGTASQPATTTTTTTSAPLNCPAGTKDAGDGTCMVTGDWKF